jgi:hypothetical protein
VGGPALAGGQVSVDGATIGFAPVEKEIPAGSHSITIVDPATGHVELRKTVRIGEHNTRVDPLRILR